MKINIIVERNNTIVERDVFTGSEIIKTGGGSTKEILEDIASMVEDLQEHHFPTINAREVEVTITEKR